MSREAEEPGAAVLGRAQRGEGGPAVANDRWHGAKRFHGVQDGGTLERSRDGRERRADARHTALAFERFQQRRLLAHFVRAGAGLRIAVEIKIRPAQIFPEISTVVRLGDRLVYD